MRWLRKLFGRARGDARPTVRSAETEARGDARPTNNPRIFSVPPQTLEWQTEDCEILRHFLTQPTGRKLVEICGGEALQEAMKEAQGDRAQPKAAGMDAMLRFQFNLASETVRQKLSGDSADQESKPADGEQNGAVPVEIRRSF